MAYYLHIMWACPSVIGQGPGGFPKQEEEQWLTPPMGQVGGSLISFTKKEFSTHIRKRHEEFIRIFRYTLRK